MAQDYIKNWQKKNKIRMRMARLVWYYRNALIVNTQFSRG